MITFAPNMISISNVNIKCNESSRNRAIVYTFSKRVVENCRMNKAAIFLISLLVLSTLTESRPRHGHRFKMKISKEDKSDESSESNEDENTCTDCTITKIGNGYKNHNEIYYSASEKQH